MTLAASARLGPYKIGTLLGAGGMGEVYRARDARLGRNVAIKVLPATFAADEDRLRRFEQEARAAGMLNHPNVLAIYDVGTHDGAPYLVSELLEGETLAERMFGGALPFRKAVDYAVQMALGLAAAHGKGIVHRDLKPQNLFITRDGRVKILDFGLAKLTQVEPGVASSTVGTASSGTGSGVVMGTPGYISPEQVMGQVADHRADVFAFGAILYEMLAGKRAFPGGSAAEIMSAILRDEPPLLSEVNPGVSRSVGRIVQHCLEKSPAERFQSAQDLALALEALSAPSGPALAVDVAPGQRRYTPAFVGLGLLGAAALAFIAGRYWAAPTISTSTVHVHRLTDFAGLEESPAVSPDGKSVAYVAEVGGHRQIWVRLIAGGSPLQVTHDPTDHLFPRWSHDSASLIYYAPPAQGESRGTLSEIPALGGGLRRIVTSVGGGDLSHDGRQIAYFEFAGGRVELRVAGRDGSAARAVAVFEPGKYYLLSPRWSPDDRFIAYHRGYVFEHDVFVVPSTGGEPRQITAKERLLRGFAWRPDGSGIVFSSPRGATTFYLPTMNLWTVDLGGQGLRQVTFGEVSYVDPDLSPGGTLVASRVRMVSDIWKFPTFGGEAENMQGAVRLTHQTSQLQTPSSSPDGMELVYLSDGGGHANLWVTSLRTGQSRQITYEQDPQVVMGVPVWSTDGEYIAFFSDRTKLGYGGLWLVDPHGSGLRELVPDAGWASWSRDGRWVYYSRTLPPRHLQKIPVGGGQPITVRTDNATRPAIATDGTLYFIVDLPSITGAPDYEIRAARPEGGPSRVLARIPAYRVPSWQLLHPVVSPDGKWLAVTLSDGVATNIWALSTADGSMRRLTDFGTRPTFIARRVSWSADGRFIYAAVGEGDADVVMLEGLMPPGASGRSARSASP